MHPRVGGRNGVPRRVAGTDTAVVVVCGAGHGVGAICSAGALYLSDPVLAVSGWVGGREGGPWELILCSRWEPSTLGAPIFFDCSCFSAIACLMCVLFCPLLLPLLLLLMHCRCGPRRHTIRILMMMMMMTTIVGMVDRDG